MSAVRSATRASVVLLLGIVLGTAAGVAGCAAAHPAHHGHARGLHALGLAYLAIAKPANHRLDVEVDAYEDNAHHNLGAAESALRAQAATERQFDRSLARIAFPPAIALTARALIRVNEIRARLTDRQAQAPSIAALLSLTGVHKMADSVVEAQVRVIRAQLGLPPPSSS